MAGDQKEQQGLPQPISIEHIMADVQRSDFDLQLIRTALDNLSQSMTAGAHLKQAIGIITSNTGVHDRIRVELHSGGIQQDFNNDNLPIRQEVARRISADTGYSFNPRTITPDEREQIWKALDALTRVHTDEAERERINLTIPYRFPPTICRVNWMADDEIIIREDNLGAIDRSIAPGHYLNIWESQYAFYKAGQLMGRLTLTEISNFDTGTGNSSRYAKATTEPLAELHNVDRVSFGPARNEFVYVSPNSPYLKRAKST